MKSNLLVETVLSCLLAGIAAASGPPPSPPPYPSFDKCLPGQPCFPSAKVLAAFNASVSGALLKPPPYGIVCYKAGWDAAACASLIEQKSRPEFRESLPGPVQYANSEFDALGNGCEVPNTVPTSPLTGKCVLGALSTYFVNVTSAAQIETTVKFIAKYNLNLVIKNTGHDYIGRSTSPGGFAIWTEHLKETTHIPNFKPAGCDATYGVIAAGAGVNVLDLYTAADKAEVLVNGGYNPTVGAAGGYWTLGGMGSPFGPELGYGVDRVISFDIVLANGTTVTASKCQNYDLYWAVKGGGGAFGVVTKVYILTYPKPAKLNIVFTQMNVTTDAAYKTFTDTLVDTSPQFRAPSNFTSCILNLTNRVMQMWCVKIFKDDASVISADQSAKALYPMKNIPGVTSTFVNRQFDTWLSGYFSLTEAIFQKGAPVGISTVDISRNLNSSTLFTAAGRQRVKNFLRAVDPAQTVIFEWNGGFAAQKYTDASINPVWRDSVGYIVPPVFSPSTGPTTAQQNATVDAVSKLLDQYIGYSPYPNEDNLRTEGWQDRYWGVNYPRLLSIKRKVDPYNVFNVKRGIGAPN